MSFPPEIIKEFISYVATDEGDTQNQRRAHLHTQCLVSRTWYGLAQPLLFAEITAFRTGHNQTGDRDTAEITELLARTLIDSPHTRSYVKTLSLGAASSHPRDPVIKIIENLTTLEGLRIVHPEYEDAFLHADLLKVLPKALNSTHLTSLGFSELKLVPLSILKYPLALEELVIHHSTFDIPDLREGAAPSPAVQRPAPKVLILSASNLSEADVLEGILLQDGPLDISRIEEFWAMDRSDGEEVYGFVCTFTSAISSTLEDVLINPPTDCFRSVELTERFPSEKLSNLRMAQFSVLQLSDERYGYNAVPWVISAITRLCNPEKLETIKLHCEFRNEESRTDEDLLDQGWVQFDSELVSGRFSNLRELDIIFYDEENGLDNSALLLKFSTLLDGASEEILMMDCSDESSYLSLVGPEWIR
ncbi:hypothetical protein BDN72DRAFT_877635 [Pluteus cervinus]|uniref:Uncharacterized protein n=1 Tax=Pluteus cervinus TaxID=181527 RepID=A0ACD3AY74_9AGAR|nr:hypothetical protein BDN72DRAFT_877635 [Pluteus cervinus]